MYEIHKNKIYKLEVWLGIIPSILSCIYVYKGVINTYIWDSFSLFMLSLGFFFPLYTLYYLVKYFDPQNKYVVFRIDNYGIFLCPNKNESVFIPWEKIRYVTFVYDDLRGTKVAILQYSKKSHYMLLSDYFIFLKIHFYPRNAVKAAYKCTDNAKKIKELKDYIDSNYESGLWDYYIKK